MIRAFQHLMLDVGDRMTKHQSSMNTYPNSIDLGYEQRIKLAFSPTPWSMGGGRQGLSKKGSDSGPARPLSLAFFFKPLQFLDPVDQIQRTILDWTLVTSGRGRK